MFLNNTTRYPPDNLINITSFNLENHKSLCCLYISRIFSSRYYENCLGFYLFGASRRVLFPWSRREMVPPYSETLECGGTGCNDFCCGCEGECNEQVDNLECHWVECILVLAQYVVACCEGSCLSSSKCISCLGSSYETCKDCWSKSEGERFRNLVIKGATNMMMKK